MLPRPFEGAGVVQQKFMALETVSRWRSTSDFWQILQIDRGLPFSVSVALLREPRGYQSVERICAGRRVDHNRGVVRRSAYDVTNTRPRPCDRISALNSVRDVGRGQEF